MAEQSYGDWKDWLLCLAIIIALEARLPGMAHKHKYESSVPKKPIQAAAQSPQTPKVSPTMMRRSITTEKLVFTISAAIVGIIFSAIGLQDVFPFVINLVIYFLGLVCIVGAIWYWEKSMHWTRRVAICVVIIAVYCGLMRFPIVKQYRKEYEIDVTFKASSTLSWIRKLIIRHDFGAVNHYLIDLDLEVPQLPPLAVTSNGNKCGESTPPGKRLFRSEVEIGQAGLSHRRDSTECYVDFVVSHIMYQHSAANINTLANVLMTEESVTNYFTSSFWNSRGTNEWPFQDTFWHIRHVLGQDFADRLVAAMVKVVGDDPGEVDETDLPLYIAGNIKIAESITDNDCEHWKTIEESIRLMGIDHEKLKQQKFQNISSVCIDRWKN